MAKVENLISVAETPNQNRDRSADIAHYHRTQKPHKIDTRPMRRVSQLGAWFNK